MPRSSRSWWLPGACTEMALEAATLCRIVQAAILAAPQPVSSRQLLGLFEPGDGVDAAALDAALAQLASDSSTLGVELLQVASGWRYQVRGELHPWVARLWSERRTRYSRATLETLALIAYRQPVTRGEIEQVRGVAVSSQIIQTLEERGWIEVVGHREVAGRPALYGTTPAFLDHFGLSRLDQLPPLQQLQALADGPDADDPTQYPQHIPPSGAPDAAPGGRAAEHQQREFNAVAMTSVAVDQADSEPEGRHEMAGRSQIDE